MKKRKNIFIGVVVILSMIMTCIPVSPIMAAQSEEHTITLDCKGNGTVLIDKDKATAGEEIVLTVIPDSGYKLKGTLKVGGNAGNLKPNGKNSYILTMPDKDVVITAEFTGDAISFNVITEPTGNGSLSANKTSADSGESVSLTVTPDEGYELETLTAGFADGSVSLTDNKDGTFSFTMPAGDVTVKASFKQKAVPPGEYLITINCIGNGTATASLTTKPAAVVTTAPAGAGILVTVKPAPGYKLLSITKRGDNWEELPIGPWGENVYIFTMPYDNAIVTVTFEPDGSNPPPQQYTITVEDDGNGTAEASAESATAGTEFALSATPNSGFRFVGWERAEVTVTNNKFTMPADDVTVKAIFELIPPTEYTITVEDDGNGTASASAVSATAGTEIALTATPNEGYRFLRWESEEVTVTNNKFTMPADDVTVKAIFELIPPTEYTITAEDDGNGTASADAVKAIAGTEITLTATPNSGYRFLRWESTDVTVTNNKFTMPADDVTVKAIFELIPPTEYTITVEDDGNGTASASAESATAGTEIALTATPNEGYRFLRWESAEVTVTDNKFTMPAKDVTVKAIFELIPPTEYSITVDAGADGTATASAASATAGTTVIITATPNSGCILDSLSVNGGTVGITDNQDGTYSFIMPAGNATVSVSFKKLIRDIHGIFILNTDEGSVEASAISAIKDTVITLTATPNSGYRFLGWESEEVTAFTKIDENTFTFIMPDKDVNVKAVFELIPQPKYNITVEAGTGGTAEANVTEAEAGTEITLTATPNSGYRFLRWESEEVTVTDNKFTMPAYDVTVKAVFKKKYTTPTVTSEPIEETEEDEPSERSEPEDDKDTALSTVNPSTGDSNAAAFAALFTALISGAYLWVSAKRIAKQ